MVLAQPMQHLDVRALLDAHRGAGDHVDVPVATDWVVTSTSRENTSIQIATRQIDQLCAALADQNPR